MSRIRQLTGHWLELLKGQEEEGFTEWVTAAAVIEDHLKSAVVFGIWEMPHSLCPKQPTSQMGCLELWQLII